jgi:hypothetical protein
LNIVKKEELLKQSTLKYYFLSLDNQTDEVLKEIESHKNVIRTRTINFDDRNGVYTGMTTTTIVPEPISSTLFVFGGGTLGFRHFRKKFKK